MIEEDIEVPKNKYREKVSCPDCSRLLSVHALKYTHPKNCPKKPPEAPPEAPQEAAPEPPEAPEAPAPEAPAPEDPAPEPPAAKRKPKERKPQERKPKAPAAITNQFLHLLRQPLNKDPNYVLIEAMNARKYQREEAMLAPFVAAYGNRMR